QPGSSEERAPGEGRPTGRPSPRAPRRKRPSPLRKRRRRTHGRRPASRIAGRVLRGDASHHRVFRTGLVRREAAMRQLAGTGARRPAARLAALALVAAALLGLAGAVTGSRASAQELSERLVVYSAAPLDFAESLKEDFEARHPGVTVEIVNPGGAEAIIARLEAERDMPQADVFHSGAVYEYLVAAEK